MRTVLVLLVSSIALCVGPIAVDAQPSKPATATDLGVEHAALVSKLKPAYECKDDASGTSTTCTRDEITVVVQGAGRAKSVTFIFPLDDEEQLAGGSVTMVALAQDVFPKWAYAKWYERNLGQARRSGANVTREGVRISASAFGKAKTRLLVVWTTEQTAVQ